MKFLQRLGSFLKPSKPGLPEKIWTKQYLHTEDPGSVEFLKTPGLGGSAAAALEILMGFHGIYNVNHSGGIENGDIIRI